MKNKVYYIFNVLVLGLLLSYQNCGKVSFDKGVDADPKPVPPIEKDGIKCLTASDNQTGSIDKPWVINDCSCLQEIQTSPKNSNKSQYFTLGQNIDCSMSASYNSGQGFQTIKDFSGTFDGAGYTVSNLKIQHSTNAQFMKLGDSSKGATIKNLNFENLELKSSVGASLFSGGINEFIKSHSLKNIKITNAKLEGISVATLFLGEYVGEIQGVEVIGAELKSNLTSASDSSYQDSQLAGLVYQLGSISGGHSSAKIADSSFNGKFVNGNFNGGLVGWVINGEVKDSTAQVEYSGIPNNRNISQTHFQFGGVALYVLGGKISNVDITGTVIAVTEKGTTQNSFLVGGLVAKIESRIYNGSLVKGEIFNSHADVNFNIKNTTGQSSDFFTKVGALVGECRNSIQSEQKSQYRPTVQNSQSTGDITFSGLKNDLYNSTLSNFIAMDLNSVSEYCDVDSQSVGNGSVVQVQN